MSLISEYFRIWLVTTKDVYCGRTSRISQKSLYEIPYNSIIPLQYSKRDRLMAIFKNCCHEYITIFVVVGTQKLIEICNSTCCIYGYFKNCTINIYIRWCEPFDSSHCCQQTHLLNSTCILLTKIQVIMKTMMEQKSVT